MDPRFTFFLENRLAMANIKNRLTGISLIRKDSF